LQVCCIEFDNTSKWSKFCCVTLAPSTVNRELELLSKVFSLAIEQGLSILNPCRKVKRFREVQKAEIDFP
jgi:hypothetical protein